MEITFDPFYSKVIAYLNSTAAAELTEWKTYSDWRRYINRWTTLLYQKTGAKYRFDF
jgi:hypothetical protein